jgi:cytoskeletal protein CcmA (bactofilin family)
MNNMVMDTPALDAAARSGSKAPRQDVDAPAAFVSAKVAAEKLQVSMAVGEGDLIEGKIKVGPGKSLVIRGVVSGTIECEGTVVILDGGKVLGEVRAAQLVNEGDIGEPKNPAKIDVGELVLGVNSRVIGDCTYDTMAVNVPNRGIRGQMIPRSEMDVSEG